MLGELKDCALFKTSSRIVGTPKYLKHSKFVIPSKVRYCSNLQIPPFY